MRLMWTGAALVLLGTIGYTLGSQPCEAKTRKNRNRNRLRIRFVIGCSEVGMAQI